MSHQRPGGYPYMPPVWQDMMERAGLVPEELAGESDNLSPQVRPIERN